MEKTWKIDRETRNGSISTMTAKVPILGPGNVDFTKEQTVTFSEGTTMVESISHTVTIELSVPLMCCEDRRQEDDGRHPVHRQAEQDQPQRRHPLDLRHRHL
ncbi:hypothetical protein CHARACLAT_028348 [Characodon lateralis]|uniref:Uncharacterized protein n=1 Tax=Characodon lateralis TaxID=208331 RepID=A0ABU7DCP2_9TELE|nr:hypothetical protein [Characodon lateralis]